VYNAEKYLKKCIESLQKQTIKEIEIVLVNDGSTDDSLSICNEYEKKDERIVIVNKLNEGVSSARNAGLKVAKGEYIGFVDADDWVEPEMYENMYYQVKHERSDVCICNYVKERNGKLKKIKLNIPVDKNFLSKTEIINYLILSMIGPENINSKSGAIMGSACRLLINKEFLLNNNIKFPVGIHFMEDLIFCVELFLKCSKVSINQGYYYHYMIHPKSAVRSYRKNLEKKQLEVFNFLENMLLCYNLYEVAKSRIDMRYINMCISNIMNEIHKDNKKNIIEKFIAVDKYCKDRKLKEIIKLLDVKSYTFRKKTVITAFKYGLSLYIFIYYILYDRIFKRLIIE